MLLQPEKNRGSQQARRVLICRHGPFVELAFIVSFLLLEWCLEVKSLKAVWLGCSVCCIYLSWPAKGLGREDRWLGLALLLNIGSVSVRSSCHLPFIPTVTHEKQIFLNTTKTLEDSACIGLWRTAFHSQVCAAH